MIGIFAPQGMNVVVMMVILRSRSFSMVREAMTPGTPQPEPISIGMKALAGQAELAEDTVHDERDARHVADVFEDCQHEKQNQHLRHEAEHRADAADDAVADQADQPFSACRRWSASSSHGA